MGSGCMPSEILFLVIEVQSKANTAQWLLKNYWGETPASLGAKFHQTYGTWGCPQCSAFSVVNMQCIKLKKIAIIILSVGEHLERKLNYSHQLN